eukprot:CAMPEP_0113315812 /NCGR_PEP_ID=MMETSP0010_2-20120614/11332_1 /TAXON_ID=216773 ORGANISM="Corethron hystrix, Strain 308" /NCGR_SAMPLE_ID=MMETSP0010_2 /ASSEMBLY_ACC=CAM_ASM_000155 /LENGTH=293 /DNA_ID=CAMNT_0000172391 /DNA_START=663 /DNA_END=1541 /DNA_ORIENTATION=+ /assembly_acc=CAM_ASM_000155
MTMRIGCEENIPVLLSSHSDSFFTDNSPIVSALEESFLSMWSDMIWKDSDSSTNMIEMNSGEESWWVRKIKKSHFDEEVKEMGKRFIGPEGTLSVTKGMGRAAILEGEDPDRRTSGCLKEYYSRWKKSNENGLMEPFFEWMNYGSGSFLSVNETDMHKCFVGEELAQTMRFNKKQRNQTAVSFEIKEGGDLVKAYYSNSGLYLPETYLHIVWGLDKQIYAAEESKSTNPQKLKHASFFRSGPVWFAGGINIGTEGKVLSFTSSSGHYKPKVEHFNRFYHFLRKMGASHDAVTW